MPGLTGKPEERGSAPPRKAAVAPYACPACKTPLALDGKLRCQACDIEFAVDAGVPVFAPGQTVYRDYDSFWCDDRPFEALPPGRHFLYSHLRYWSFRERRYFEDQVEPDSLTLDLGCWTGNRAYRQFGPIVGIDLCLSAAQKAGKKYDSAVQGLATDLPFVNECFDCVLSSHVFGHLANNEKERAVAEFYRKYFLDRYGHIDMEVASAAITRFEQQGFQLEKVVKMDAAAVPPWYYQQYFNNEYAGVDPRLRRRLRSANMLCSTLVSRFLLGFVVGIFHSTWEQWFGRLDDSMHIAVSFRKPNSEHGSAS